VHVVVGPAAPVNRGPGGLGLRVEGARRGIVLVRVDGHSRVALGLEVSAPRLIGLEPVATELGVVAAKTALRVPSQRAKLSRINSTTRS
jgi:hypothetical protein